MTANEALNNYMVKLAPAVRIAKSRDIRQFCKVTRFVLSDWRTGRSKIPVECRVKITEALEEEIFVNVES